MVGKDVNSQYSKFCESYETGVLKFVHLQNGKKTRIHDWFKMTMRKPKRKRYIKQDTEGIGVSKLTEGVNRQEMAILESGKKLRRILKMVLWKT